MSLADKYNRLANGFAEREYTDPEGYNLRKASRAVKCGHRRLESGSAVLELGCGDGIISYHFAQVYGMQVIGVDVAGEMVRAAQKRCERCVPQPIFLVGDLNDLSELRLPRNPIVCTTLFRSSNYVRDWPVFAQEIYIITPKLVMDVNPRTQDIRAIRRALQEAGFHRLWSRPFFTPMTRRLPHTILWALGKIENVSLLSDLILRHKSFITLIAEH